jgi:hypothetical protein
VLRCRRPAVPCAGRSCRPRRTRSLTERQLRLADLPFVLFTGGSQARCAMGRPAARAPAAIVGRGLEIIGGPGTIRTCDLRLRRYASGLRSATITTSPALPDPLCPGERITRGSAAGRQWATGPGRHGAGDAVWSIGGLVWLLPGAQH